MFQVRLFITYPTDLSNVTKITANINTMQNNNIFAFCSFTVLCSGERILQIDQELTEL